VAERQHPAQGRLAKDERSAIMPGMSLARYLILPAGIVVLGVVYWFVSDYEWVGSVMLIVFGLAMAVLGWILVPTVANVGPTAPIDPDFEDPGR
jgi:hypothetical protein